MKEKIGCLLLIIISIVGSRLIFGMDYHLNSDNLKEENLYVYNSFRNEKVLDTYFDKEDFYYIQKINNNHYKIIKYNLTSNKKSTEYELTSNNELKKVSLFKQNGNIYLIINGNVYYKFDKYLNEINKDVINMADVNLFGIYNDNIVYAKENAIFYGDKLYGEVPLSCGDGKEIIYDRDTYLHFYNKNTGFGCLYNLVNRKIEYLDYENAQYVQNKLLEYQSNRLSFKYDGITYYFNDITESNNLKMHDSGDYLFTVDTTNNKLRIYNIESRKIIYEKNVADLKGATISNIAIDDYVFFILTNGKETSLYVWDYLKETRINKDMISFDEKEYKFKNNELKEEIKSKYNIDIYMYDQAVTYFSNAYVIPSYDDILINSRLIDLKDILNQLAEEELSNLENIKICFEKDIISAKLSSDSSMLIAKKDNSTFIAIKITDDNFKSIVEEKINNLVGKTN